MFPPLLSSKRRALAPVLSPEYINSARSQPSSNASSHSSFLTPILYGEMVMSPPPRQEAEDYLQVHNYPGRKSSHRKRQQRKLHNTREEFDEPQSPQLSPTALSQPAGSVEADRAARGPDVSGKASDVKSESPLSRNIGKIGLAPSVQDSQAAVPSEPDDMRSWPRTVPSPPDFDDAESPAINALRNIGQPQESETKVENFSLRRMSTAISKGFGLLTSRRPTLEASNKDGNPSQYLEQSPQRSEINRKSLTYQSGVPNQSSVLESGYYSKPLRKPTTIILRKASNVYAHSPAKSSMTATLMHEDPRKSVAEAPASELLAFYSTSKNDFDKPISPELPSSEQAVPSKEFIGHVASGSGFQPLGKKSTSTIPSISAGNVRRRSVLAETAITFSDVHVAPGTFAVEPLPRRLSIAPADTLRRISVVQFRTRNSIHEVIWREDESPSGSSFTGSSTASGSPPRQGPQSQNMTTGISDNQGSLIQASGVIKNGQGKCLPASTDPSTSSHKPRTGFFPWSWSKSISPAESAPCCVAGAPKDSPTEATPRSALSPDSPSLHGPALMPSASGHERPSIPDLPGAHSFSPLPEHCSTAELCEDPLVDLNDHPASRESVPRDEGQDECVVGHDTKYTDGITYDEQVTRPDKRRLNSHPIAPSRTGLKGRTGSSIGASSHAKIPPMGSSIHGSSM